MLARHGRRTLVDRTHVWRGKSQERKQSTGEVVLRTVDASKHTSLLPAPRADSCDHAENGAGSGRVAGGGEERERDVGEAEEGVDQDVHILSMKDVERERSESASPW